MRARGRGPLAARLDRLAARRPRSWRSLSRRRRARRRRRCASAFVRSSRTPAFSAGRSGELLAFSGWAGTVSHRSLSSSRTGYRLLRRGSCSAPVRWCTSGQSPIQASGWTITVICADRLPLGRRDHGGVTLGAVRPSEWFSLGVFALLSFSPAVERWPGAHAGSISRPELRLGITGVRTVALQGGYFVGAAVGGVALPQVDIRARADACGDVRRRGGPAPVRRSRFGRVLP